MSLGMRLHQYCHCECRLTFDLWWVYYLLAWDCDWLEWHGTDLEREFNHLTLCITRVSCCIPLHVPVHLLQRTTEGGSRRRKKLPLLLPLVLGVLLFLPSLCLVPPFFFSLSISFFLSFLLPSFLFSSSPSLPPSSSLSFFLLHLLSVPLFIFPISLPSSFSPLLSLSPFLPTLPPPPFSLYPHTSQ